MDGRVLSAVACRSCGAPLRHQVIDLGMSPLCESFLQEDQLDQAEVFHPLRVLVCDACYLVQLREYVSAGEIFGEYARLVESDGLEYVCFGHLGDSHVHMNIIPHNDEQLRKGLSVYSRLMEITIEAGGSVSAEHGIGKLKTAYLEKMFGESAIAEMKKVKSALDPKWLLGRGNLFDC